MTTKVEHINSAYSQMRISGITVNPTPEDTQTALRRLEDMMWELYGRTIDLNYNFEGKPHSSSESGIEPVFNHMIATNLAVRLLPDFGKDATPELNSLATASLHSAAGVIARQRLNGVKHSSRMPVGSGNRQRTQTYRKYYPATSNPIASAVNSALLCGEADDFFECFDAWLEGEEIESYSITVGAGLSLLTGIVDPDNPPFETPTGAVSADPNFATACGAGNWVCTGGATDWVIAGGEASVGVSSYAILTNSSFVWDPTKTYTVTIQYDDATKSYAYGQILCGNETAVGQAGNIQVDDAPDGSLDRVTGIQTVTVTGVSGTGFTYENYNESNDAIANTLVELKVEEVVAPYVPIDSYDKDGCIHWRLQADACPYSGTACVTIEVTTDTGRVDKRERLITIESTC